MKMSTLTRSLMALAGLGLIFFGLACLNYSKESTLEHHTRWAEEHGAPPPGRGIFVGGVGSIGIGVGTAGFGLLARRNRGR